MPDTIAIIGAGPAGLTTAHFLAKAGIPHVLIDRAAFPREKVCGESYDGKVFHTLRRIDASLPHRMLNEGIVQPARQYGFTINGGSPLTIRFPGDATPRLQGRRYTFDAYLLQELLAKGYTDWRPGARVVKYVRTANAWRLHLPDGAHIDAAVLVWAAGSQAPSPFLPRLPDSGQDLVFYRAHFQHSLCADKEEPVRFHLGVRPVPLCWVVCPLAGGYYNVELGVRRRDLGRLKQPLRAFFWDSLHRQPALQATLQGAVATGPGSGAHLHLHRTGRLLSGWRWLVAGSAAVQVNPITGMGVGNAMLMGRIAAQTLIGHTSWEKLSAYDQEVRRALRQEIYFSRLVTWLQHHPQWVALPAAALLRSRRVQHWLHQPDLIAQFTNPAFYRRR